MGQMTFKIDDKFRDMVAFCERHKPQGCYDQRIKPGTVVALWLVHDQGVYLMPGIVDGGKAEFVIYARGCDPDKNPDTWYDRSRDLVGGDDFAECFEFDAKATFAMMTGKATKLVLKLTETSMTQTLYFKAEATA